MLQLLGLFETTRSSDRYKHPRLHLKSNHITQKTQDEIVHVDNQADNMTINLTPNYKTNTSTDYERLRDVTHYVNL